MMRVGKAQKFLKLLADKDVIGLREYFKEMQPDRYHIDTSEVITELARLILNEV